MKIIFPSDFQIILKTMIITFTSTTLHSPLVHLNFFDHLSVTFLLFFLSKYSYFKMNNKLTQLDNRWNYCF